MSEPNYLKTARSYIGVKEISGIIHSKVITGWLIKLNAWWSDDETPWCGVYVAHCMKLNGHEYPKLYMRAREWLKYGAPIYQPRLGCIVVFERTGGGHVGFVVGVNNTGKLLVLGGNQGNAVSIAAFDKKRVLAYRQPPNVWLNDVLPVLSLRALLSANEA